MRLTILYNTHIIMRYEKTIEEYVEIIAEILSDNPVARVKDIAASRGVTHPTVSSAIEKLKEQSLVVHEHYGYVTLTQQGWKLARELEAIHNTFKKLFVEVLGIDKNIADSDACSLEHHISPITQEAMVKFLVFLERCPQLSNILPELYQQCSIHDQSNDLCKSCHPEIVIKMRTEVSTSASHHKVAKNNETR